MGEDSEWDIVCGITDNGIYLLVKAIKEKYTTMNQLNIAGGGDCVG